MKRLFLLIFISFIFSFPVFGIDKDPTSKNYRDFTSLDQAKELAKKGPVVLFFYADWCPNCKAADREIRAKKGSLGDIVVLRVDYDKASNLKSKYGVTYQHTFVIIDTNGEKTALWNGGGIEKIIKNTRRQ